MAKKWYYTPEGKAALYRQGNYLYRSEDNICQYWQQGGSWHQVCTGTMAAVKETELWQRLQLHLGAGYFRVWASEYSLAALGQRTVVEALADGVPCKIIWRAVWAALELPARDR